MKYIFVAILSFIIACNALYSQDKGEPEPKFNPDTTFIFYSPRPLINPNQSPDAFKNAWGIDLLFSESGFGMGAFYQKTLAKDYFGFLSLYISGARNTDEFESYDENYQLRVPNKINRLYIFPLMLGFQKNFFTDELTSTLRPYLSIGFGPTLIMSTPYEKEFFTAFGSAKFYGRFGGFIGAGANFGSSANMLTGINIRYYYIPFGGKGLESIRDLPIETFGGIYLSLTIGEKY